MRHEARLVLLSLLCLSPAGRSLAAPQPGGELPSLNARDVTGERHELADLLHGSTLLVAITDRHAGDAMRAWFEAARTRAPAANEVSIISIGKPFFVSDGYARSRAREQVPRRWWHASLFDSDHSMAEKLELDQDTVPYAFAVGPDGRVLAEVHGTATSPEAQQIWQALGRARRR